jgi:hypothetical protein
MVGARIMSTFWKYVLIADTRKMTPIGERFGDFLGNQGRRARLR